MAMLTTHVFETNLGTMRAAATEKGLVMLALPNESSRDFEYRLIRLVGTIALEPDITLFKQVENEITEYLDGRRKQFTITLDIRGSEFHRLV